MIDFGTATTFDCISKEGAYFGGVIIPGIGISTNALFSRAAKLPQVKFIKPDKIIGHNTVDMIQSGIVYGFIGQLESIVKEIIKDERMGPETSIILTGGFCKKLAPYVNKDYHIDENLTLFGLNNIALGK